MAVEDEKVYTIPLRDAFAKSRFKRTPYAVSIVQKYLKTHMKAKNVKIGKHLNEELWERGQKKPPRRVRIKAFMDGETAKAELMGFEYEEFKTKPRAERKGFQEKLLSRLGPKALQKEAEKKMIEGEKTEPSETKKETTSESVIHLPEEKTKE